MIDYERFGGRRWILAQEVFLASCVLLGLGKLTSEAWVAVTLGIAGVYVAGNVAQKKIEGSNGGTT